MAVPAIIWRNSKVVQRRRIWNQARSNENSRLYIVVRSHPGGESQWEGLPNLEVLEGGNSRTNGRLNGNNQSGAQQGRS